MKDRDPWDAGPVAAPHRGSYFGPDQFGRQIALDARCAGLQRLYGGVLMREACAARLLEKAHKSRQRDTELVRVAIHLDDREAECLGLRDRVPPATEVAWTKWTGVRELEAVRRS